MFAIRKAAERGAGEHGWLHSRHTFSFASYYDPDFMGFRSLRVMNEDRVDPNAGFPTHGHRDMEIISYVLSGQLEHKDSLGNGSVLKPGELQRMTAGTGIRHSEFNPSPNEVVHFYQIWIEPAEKGLTPGYEQKFFDIDNTSGDFRIVASPDARDGSLKIHQDAMLALAKLRSGQSNEYTFEQNRSGWLQVLSGAVTLNENVLQAGDGVAIRDEKLLKVQADEDAQVLLFDLN